jgi:hypothetical protein
MINQKSSSRLEISSCELRRKSIGLSSQRKLVMHHISRRDFLKLSASGLLGLGVSPLLGEPKGFDDSIQVHVATKSVSVYRKPTDKSAIVGQLFRDELVNIYQEVDSDEPS